MFIYLKLITTGQLFKIEIPEDLTPTVLNLKKLLAPKLGIILPSPDDHSLETPRLLRTLSFPEIIFEGFKSDEEDLSSFLNTPLEPLNFNLLFPEPSTYSSTALSSASYEYEIKIKPYSPAPILPTPSIQWTARFIKKGLTSTWEEPLAYFIKEPLGVFLKLLLIDQEISPKRYPTYFLIQASVDNHVLGYAVFSSEKLALYRGTPTQTSPGKGIDLKEIHWFPNSGLGAGVRASEGYKLLEQSFENFIQGINTIFPRPVRSPSSSAPVTVKTVLETERDYFVSFLENLNRPPKISLPVSSTPSVLLIADLAGAGAGASGRDTGGSRARTGSRDKEASPKSPALLTRQLAQDCPYGSPGLLRRMLDSLSSLAEIAGFTSPGVLAPAPAPSAALVLRASAPSPAGRPKSRSNPTPTPT